jgi:hypothetical protein
MNSVDLKSLLAPAAPESHIAKCWQATVTLPIGTHVSELHTSSCNALLQAVVQEALNRLMAGRTVVVVAHRLSTIRDAHRICVVSQGQLAEQGSHEQLMAAKGMYAQLIGRQMMSSSSPSLSRPASASSLSVFSGGGCDSEGSRGCSVDAVVPAAAAAAASGGSAAGTPRGGAGSSSSAGSSQGVSRS